MRSSLLFIIMIFFFLRGLNTKYIGISIFTRVDEKSPILLRDVHQTKAGTKSSPFWEWGYKQEVSIHFYDGKQKMMTSSRCTSYINDGGWTSWSRQHRTVFCKAHNLSTSKSIYDLNKNKQNRMHRVKRYIWIVQTIATLHTIQGKVWWHGEPSFIIV